MSEVLASASPSAVSAARDLRVVFGRLRRRLREAATQDVLSPTQTSVLMRLGKGEAESASDLAAVEGVRPQSMAAILAVLDEQGLIRREQDPGDGRRQLIRLTAAGRQSFAGAQAAKEEWLVRALQDRFTEDERAVLNRSFELLERLAR